MGRNGRHDKLLTFFLNTFFPAACVGCHRYLSDFEDVLCEECKNNLPYFNPVLDHPIHVNILGGRVPLMHLGCLLRFTKKSSIQNIMHGIKYENRKDLAVYLGMIFGRELRKEKFCCDVLVPVPIHVEKRRERGYNQAFLIALGISEVTGIPVDETIVVKTHHTRSQTKMNREQRALNLKDSFGLGEGTGKYNGKHLALVDDVLTTGATTEQIWRTLSQMTGITFSALYLCHARD